MAVYTVIARQRLDDYAVVQTLTDTPIEPGQSVTLAGLGDGLDGTHTVLFCPQYAYTGTLGTSGEWTYNPEVPRANQILFYDPGDNIEFSTVVPTGTLTWTQTCTWITNTQISNYLDIPLTSTNAAALLVQCAAAANAFAFRRRVEAGYLQDSLTTSPGGDVTLGTIMIGAAYFRQQGSYTALASFDGMGVPPANGITPMVLQLLGINRPQVA
jgi:hypothetical protein